MKYNLEERLIYWSICLIYLWYLTGTLFIVSIFTAFFLLARLFYLYLKGQVTISTGSLLWGVSALLLLIENIVSNLENETNTLQIVIRSISFLTNIGFIGLVPLLGNLPIRKEVVVRAACHLMLQSMVLFPLFVLAASMKFTGYLSPFVKFDSIFKAGPINFQIAFYNELEPWRFKMFAPWCPALGFIACQYFFICQQETTRLYRWIGMIGSTFLVLISFSRLGLFVIPLPLAIGYLKGNYRKLEGWWGFYIGLLLSLIGEIKEQVKDIADGLNSARSSSSLIRERLRNIAYERALEDNLWWGHGGQEKGGPILAKMPIGSHHTWYGLLFTNGLLGVLLLAIPYLVSLLYFYKREQLAFNLLLVFGMYSIGETWGSLSYLSIPALLLIGQGFKDESVN